ncbi:MAG TPA: DoxX-like family protein, partial [Allosphingosinicella sp.]|nr:DoxX-like family protein [Allosphingosinicella sp.]
VTFLLFWALTGVVALTVGWDQAVRTMLDSPAAPVARLTVVAGALADLAVAGLLLFRRTAKLGLLAAVAVTISYVVSGTLLRPDLWADPLGPMMKVWPILALNLILLAMLDER